MPNNIAKNVRHRAMLWNLRARANFSTAGYWWEPSTKSKYGGNYGDELNHLILRHFAGTPVINCYGFQELKHFMLIGSVLAKANENSVVLGSGIISEKEAISREAKIIACRGPYSSRRVLSETGHLPSVISDPALIMPDVVAAEKIKNGRILLIAHFRHFDELSELLANEDIDVVSTSTHDVVAFTRLATSYSFIASTSLHGLILAHAYDIPAMYIPFSGLGCEGIKFWDYYESIEYTLQEHKIDSIGDKGRYTTPDQEIICAKRELIRHHLSTAL